MCQEHRVSRLRPALGTFAGIEARAPTRLRAERALAAGYAALARVEALLHPARAGSDLARLNAAPAGRRVAVHPWTAELLRLSRELCLLSAGRFEPALPDSGTVLQWLPEGPRTLYVRRAAQVDLGGIAKGFAVDQAVAAMRRAGASAGLVNAGGDLRVFGREAWPLWIRLGDAPPRQLLLQEAALAGSDPGSTQPPAEHRGYYAPRSTRRSTPHATAVMAPSAALADALTKVLVYAARGRNTALLARYRAQEIRPLS
ncbi:MAG TPA: FAD:protein FMN transferase [Steroidobacteraceae bacterium]|nr:FAD:protein FMN transferase [Steroidobacteraceae bacterium]